MYGGFHSFGAGDRTRTDMKLPSRDFKSLASAVSPHRRIDFETTRRSAGRFEFLEAPSGFGPENEGFADLCLTTWLWRLKASLFLASI